MLYFSLVRQLFSMVFVANILAAAQGQTSGKVEFEVASVKANASQSGFHLAAEAFSGGPGTSDPAMFRCSKCSLASLILKAFKLQPYQFPARRSFGENTYEIRATIPAGATPEEFSAMLQSLLKQRFGLVWHFQERAIKGYHLVQSGNGSKLVETTGEVADPHRPGQPEPHTHSAAVVFGSSASYRASSQTIADLIRVLSDQLSLPVDDQTGLSGKYDISLRWSGASGGHAGDHADGAFGGGGGHGWHDGGSGAQPGVGNDFSGPGLFDALAQQLGLRLVPADQAVARVFVVDRVAQRPTEN